MFRWSRIPFWSSVREESSGSRMTVVASNESTAVWIDRGSDGLSSLQSAASINLAKYNG